MIGAMRELLQQPVTFFFFNDGRNCQVLDAHPIQGVFDHIP